MSVPSERARSVRPFLVMEILERAQHLQAQGHDIVHLEVGEPDFDTPPSVTAAGISALRNGRTHYTHSLGVLELREAIANSMRERYGVTVDPDRIVVTPGSSPAIALCFASLLDPGDEILVADPGYACYPNIARTVGAVSIGVPVDHTTDFALDPSAVSDAITGRTRAVVVNSPGNPTGTLIGDDAFETIVGLGLPVVSDEIYHGLVYDGCRPRSVLEFTDDAFVVSGFSKRHAMTGWRIGYAVVPAGHIDSVRAMQQNVVISAPDFGQHAAVAALGALDDAEAMRRTFDERRRHLLARLPDIGFDVPATPRGAFYVFADARRFTDDSMAFALQVLDEAHVALTPGIDFGPRGEGFVRFSYATSLERIDEGLDRLAAYLR